MSSIAGAIAPIFMVIILGVVLRRVGFLPDNFVRPANNLVYWVGIPAMIFLAVAHTSFSAAFNPLVALATLLPVVIAMGMGLLAAKLMRLSAPETGTFTQSSFHGNVGYVGLAVAFYFLGDKGFAQASILAGFLILIQNFLAVEVLTAFQEHKPGRKWSNLIRPIALHPAILATLAGMIFSLSGIRVPEILERWLSIVKGMALPMALLIIGASLSPTRMKRGLRLALTSGCIKLILEPAAGLGLATLLGLAIDQYLPGFVTIATPTATFTYVMAVGMSGDPDQASAAISISTLLSGVTYTLWLGLLT